MFGWEDLVGNPAEFGLVGFSLLIVWKILEVMKTQYLMKRGISDAGNVEIKTACMVDPMYPQRIKEVHESITKIDQGIASGIFQCAWKGRDEVRDLLEIQRTLIAEMKLLREEMVRTRKNGAG